MRLISILAGTILAAAAGAAHAHHVWIEDSPEGAILRFGEFGEGVQESSPGLLDKFPGPVAQMISAGRQEAVAVSKFAKGWSIAAKPKAGGSIIAAEPAYPLFDTRQGERTLRGAYVPAARLVTGLGAQEPKLALDLVPTGRSGREGIEFQAFFKGEPLPKAKVEVVTPSGWGRTEQTGQDGKFTVALPWKGPYVLELSHRDDAGGVRANGEKYDRADYVTSLSVTRKRGLAPPAR